MSDLIALPTRHKVVVVVATSILYVILVVALYPVFHASVGSLAFLPVAVTAWLFGTLPGLIASIAMILLDSALFVALGAGGWDAFFRMGGIPGLAALLGTSLIIGPLHTLSQRLRREVARREEAQRAMTEERTLAEALRLTATSLTGTLDFDDVMSRILNNVWRVLPHDAANIMLIEGRTGRVVGQRGYRERGLELELLGTRFMIDELPNFQKLLESKSVLLIPNTKRDPLWVKLEIGEWVKSYLSAPILIDGKVVGAINLDSMTEDFFTPPDAERLQAFADQAAIAIRNAQLYSLTQEKVNRLELVSQISQGTTAILDLDKLLREAVHVIRDSFGYYNVLIQIVEGDYLVVKAASHPALSPVESLPRLKVGEQGITGWVAAHGEPLLVPDVWTDKRHIFFSGLTNLQSELAVPIRLRDMIIGVLDVESDRKDAFSEVDITTLQTAADQLAIAIQNARLYERIQRREHYLEAVSQISQRTTAILDLDKLLPEAVRLINESFGYYSTLIQLVDQESLVVKAASHPALNPVEDLPRLKVGEQGITGWVAAHGEPLLVPDTAADPRFFFYEATRETRSELAVPIRLRDIIIGVLDVESDRKDAFSEIDIATLQTVADQLAIAIQNARLYERIRRRERYLEAVTRVGLRASPERDPARYMQLVADSLLAEFNYSRVLIMLGDDKARTLRVGAYAGDRMVMTPEKLHSFRQSYDTGILGRVMKTSRPYLARDTSKDPYFVGPVAWDNIASELAVPINQQGKTLGVLSVQSTRKDNFSDVDLEIMSEVGAQLGINMENVELSDALRRHADELEDRVARRTAELQAAKERLEELDKMKSKFVADVSHELRIPVTNLSLYIDLLESGTAAKRHEYLRTFREQVSRLATLVESILNLSRLELGKTRLSFVPVNLNSLIEPVIDAFGPRASDTGLKLTFTPAKKLPEVVGAPDQLTEVISNLISNAIRYTTEGEVHVSTGVDKQHWRVRLTVQDTGMGIDPEDIPHLYERFYRGKGAAQSDIPGTGLGLAIVKEIVDLHGGTVEVSSTPDDGSTFSVTLPLPKMG